MNKKEKEYSKDRFKKAYDYVLETVKLGKLPTGILGIAQKDRIISLEAYGTWPDGRQADTEDIYLIFSVTKPIVALAIMQLWENGKLHPNEPVIKYIPEFGKHGKESITIWHLLTHTSGLRQKAIERLLTEKPFPEIDIYSEFIESDTDYHVGAKKRYNNMAFSVLGEVITRVSGMDYDIYMEKNIFSPLGMKDTSFYKPGMPADRVIPIVNPLNFNTEGFYKMKLPAGGLFSTVRDLLILGQALLNDGLHNNEYRLICPATLRTMITPHTTGIAPFNTEDFNGMETGLAWLLPVNSHSIIYKNIYGHHGAGNSMMWVYPEEGLALVFLSNYCGPAIRNMQWEYILNVFSSCLDI